MFINNELELLNVFGCMFQLHELVQLDPAILIFETASAERMAFIPVIISDQRDSGGCFLTYLLPG